MDKLFISNNRGRVIGYVQKCIIYNLRDKPIRKVSDKTTIGAIKRILIHAEVNKSMRIEV